MKDCKPFYRFAEENVQPKRKDICAKTSPEVYKSILRTMYAGKTNLACTCKLHRYDNDEIHKYTFNEAKMELQSWIDNCKNDACFKEWYDTFQKCKCF